MSSMVVVPQSDELLCATEQLSPVGSMGAGQIENEAGFMILEDDIRDSLRRALAKERSTGFVDYLASVQSMGMKKKWRQLCCKWMFETGKAFGLAPDTVACAITFLDVYLSEYPVDKAHLQLACMVAMFIASKMHETQPITLEELDLLGQGRFSKQMFTEIEPKLLSLLKWDLNPVTPYTIARHGFALLQVSQDVISEAEKLLQAAMEDYDALYFKPSTIAFAVLNTVLKAQASELPVTATDVIECQKFLSHHSFFYANGIDKSEVRNVELSVATAPVNSSGPKRKNTSSPAQQKRSRVSSTC